MLETSPGATKSLCTPTKGGEKVAVPWHPAGMRPGGANAPVQITTPQNPAT